MDVETSNAKDPPSSGKGGRVMMKLKKLLRVDTVTVGIILVVVWSLLLLPIIFYYIPVATSNNKTNEVTFSNISCSGAIEYSGDSCREYLLSFADLCDNTSFKSVRVFRDASTETSNLIASFNLVGGEECIQAAIPFLCLFYFGGVCDRHGVKQVPTSDKCLSLSTGVCQREWALGLQSGFNLPDCDSLPDSTPPLLTCMNSTISNITAMLINNSSRCPSTCRERFICDDFSPNPTNSCIPRCPDWNLFPSGASLTTDVLVGVSAYIGTIVGVANIVVSIFRRKKLLTFPSILVFYETVSLLLILVSVSVTFFDRSRLYCTSPNLIRSIETATGFCIFTGMLTISVPIQLNIWAVTHMVVLLWTIRFPIQAQTARATKNLRIVHIASLLTGLLYPLLPITTTIVTSTLQKQSTIPFGRLGFGIIYWIPPILCTSTNPRIVFYLTILPSVLLVLVGMTVLVLIIWTLHRKHGIINSLMSKSTLALSTAEMKLLLLFFHYIIFRVIFFVYFARTLTVFDKLKKELVTYFTCESRGHDADNPCSRSGFENLVNPGLTAITIVLIGLLPVSSSIFVVDYQYMKKFVRSAFRKIFTANK